MGLDVTAFPKVELKQAIKSDDVKWDEREDEEDEEYLWEGPAADRMAPLVPGFYKTSPGSVGFRAGSYGGYNRWRSQLAQLAGLSQDDAAWNTPGPFSELVYFADNEGTIGPEACTKLAADFRAWRDRACAFAGEFPEVHERMWFVSRYDDWMQAFELARDGGAVKLH
jgi:hypothetical protein